MVTAHRTYLFAPANHPRRAEKVFQVGADAAILDLEDAVATSEKESARADAVAALANRGGCGAFIRVNDFATDFCFGDVEAVAVAGLDGIMLPKVESAAQIEAVAWMLSALERARGLADGGIEIVPIVETGQGLAEAEDIAGADARVGRICFGAADYAADMNLRWTRDERELDHARAEVVLASRLAGIEPPLDTVWTDLRDVEGLRASAERVRDMGFQGKLAIHPDQVAVINAVFTPSDDEVALAGRMVEAFEKAEREGLASIQVDGHFVDYPVYERAKRTLAAARPVG